MFSGSTLNQICFFFQHHINVIADFLIIICMDPIHMQPTTMEMMWFSCQALGQKGITDYSVVIQSKKCDDDTFICQIHYPVAILFWLMPTHSWLCKSNSLEGYSIVLLHVWVSSLIYIQLRLLSIKNNLSSKWRLRLLNFQSSYLQQSDIVHSLSCMSATLVRARTQAAEAQRPYGADGSFKSYRPLSVSAC